MSDLSPDVADALSALNEVPAGAAQVAAAEQVLVLAQRTGRFTDELTARIALAQAYYFVPEPPENFVQFVWLRRALDHPECTDESQRAEICWMMKWAMDRMTTMPGVTLEAISELIDDIEAVYRREGFQLRPVISARIALARARGDNATADRLMALWQSTPRDEMSDCHACEIHDQANQYAYSDLQRALETAAPVLDGEYWCGHEPERILADVTLWLEEAGQLDEAVAAHRRGWPMVRHNPLLMTSVATHLVALTRLGNVERALPQLLARMSWADEPTDARSQLDWFTATAFVLEVAIATGLAPERVRSVPTADVATDFRERAHALAAQFDARNGSAVVSNRVTARLNPARVRSTPTLTPLTAPAPAASTAPAPSSSREFVVALDAARDALDGPAFERLRSQWRDRRDALVAAETATAATLVDQAMLHRMSARGQTEADTRTLLQASLSAATRAVEAAGQPDAPGDEIGDQADHEAVRASVAVMHAEAELAMLDARVSDDEQARAASVAQVRRLASTIENLGDPSAASAVHWLLADQLPDAESLTALREALRLSRQAPHPVRTTLIVDELVRALADVDPEQVAEAEREQRLREARTLLAAARETADPRADAPVTLRLAATAAVLAEIQHDPAEALRLVEQVADASSEPVTAPARLHGLRLLSDQSTWPQVVARARELIAIAARCSDQGLAAEAQHMLAAALSEQGQHGEAAELLEHALPILLDTRPHRVGSANWLLGETLLELGQFDDARTAFAAASARFELQEAWTACAHAQLRAGQAAWQVDDCVAADTHCEAAERLAAQEGELELFAQATRTHADVQAVDDVDLAVTSLDGLPTRLGQLAREHDIDEADVDLGWLTAAVLHQGAILLGADGRADEALHRLDRTLVAATQANWDEALIARVQADRAEMLADSDRFEEAEVAIRALPTLDDPAFARSRRDAVAALCRGLDLSGETERAERLWAELSGTE